MTSVMVRELRQPASALLRRVKRGETVGITDRGRPVAVSAPIPERGGIYQLRATGLKSATADLGDLPEPLSVAAENPLPSAWLAALRRDER